MEPLRTAADTVEYGTVMNVLHCSPVEADPEETAAYVFTSRVLVTRPGEAMKKACERYLDLITKAGGTAVEVRTKIIEAVQDPDAVIAAVIYQIEVTYTAAHQLDHDRID